MDYPEHANSAKNAALFIQITYPCATRATVNLIWTCQEANFTGHAHDFKLFGPKAILDSKLMLFETKSQNLHSIERANNSTQLKIYHEILFINT